MSKDYSHIKQGMYVSLEGIEAGSELELSIIDAFVQAGARKDEGRDESFNCKMECVYDYLGWSFDYGTYFTDDEDYGGFSESVSVDFILNGPKISSETTPLSKGDKFKIKNGIPDIHWYKPEDWYTFHSSCNEGTGVVTQEDVDVGYKVGECWVEVDHIDFSSIVKTSSEALQDTLEEEGTEVLAKEENGLESNTGTYKASLTTFITLEVGHMLFKLDKEQAKAIYKDLGQIFEDEIR